VLCITRYTDATLSTASLDGVICMGKQSSKVCFWDNQWTVNGTVQSFGIPAGTQIPIGVPSTAGGKYQAGGRRLNSARAVSAPIATPEKTPSSFTPRAISPPAARPCCGEPFRSATEFALDAS